MGPKSLLLDLRGDQPAVGQPERLDRGVQLPEIDSRVDQRPQRHVAADSGQTIQISDSHRGVEFYARGGRSQGQFTKPPASGIVPDFTPRGEALAREVDPVGPVR